MSKATYRERLNKWRAGRVFNYINPVFLEKGQATCDACGSKLVKTFYIIQGFNTGQTFMVGKDCFEHLDKANAIWYQFKGDRSVIIEKHLASRGLGKGE